MPIGASEVADDPYLRLLALGAAKVGKTTCCVTTSPRGVYVINCDDPAAIRPAARAWKREDGGLCAVKGDEFAVDHETSIAEMETAIETAREGTKIGKYRTIIWDTLSGFAGNLELEVMQQTDSGKGPDGRRAWPEYEKRLRNIINRLFRLKAHVIVTSHYLDVGGEVTENQMAKTGPGLVPLLGGKSRGTIPALFQDVVFFEKIGDERVFVTGIEGVWGPGCRNATGNRKIPANVRTLMKEFGISPEIKKKKKKKPTEQAQDASPQPAETTTLVESK